MRPEERDAGLLWDMLAHAREVSEIVRNRAFEDYSADRMLRLAVERVVQIIGEAAFKVSKPFRESTPQIPWVPIIKQRHVLVHDYGLIVNEKIWTVATVHAPALVSLLEGLLPPTPPDPLPEPPDIAGP